MWNNLKCISAIRRCVVFGRKNTIIVKESSKAKTVLTTINREVSESTSIPLRKGQTTAPKGRTIIHKGTRFFEETRVLPNAAKRAIHERQLIE